MKKGSILFYLTMLILCVALIATGCAGTPSTGDKTQARRIPPQERQPIQPTQTSGAATGDRSKSVRSSQSPADRSHGHRNQGCRIIYQDYINANGA